MGPNIPSFTDAVAGNSSGQGLGQDISNLAPLATTWHGAQTGVNAQQVLPTTSQSSPGVLTKFEGFLGNIFHETGHIISGATSWLAHTTVDMAMAPIHYGEALGHGILDQINLSSINAQNQQLSDKAANLQQAFKAGRMNAKQYGQAMNDLSQEFQNLSKESTAIGNKATVDQKAAVKATVDTASALVTILTAGLGTAPAAAIGTDGVTPLATKTAGEWLGSQAAKPFLDPATEFIAKTISQPEVFKALSPAAQEALQRSAAEVVAQGGRMTAGQIAKATAANLALKYPLYYAATSQTADQLYKELDQKKYGDAVRTLAFNAALLLSGGPIGHAMKFGGDAVKGISAKTFGKTSFWDELSKYYGDQTPGGFRNAVVKATANMSEAEKSQLLRNLSAVEATNVGAAGDAIAAARRVATGMTANDGIDLSTVSHEEALHNMVNFAEAQRLADQAAKDAGLGQVAVGRVDARQLNEISARLSRIGLPAPGEVAPITQDAVDMSKAPEFLQPSDTKQITRADSTAALKQEALKYKSADEFVKAKVNAFHGSTNDKLTSLTPGSKTGLNEKRNLVYLTDNEKTAADYAKTRGTDGSGLGELSTSPTGTVYPAHVSGQILDAYDRQGLDKLTQAPGFANLSGKTRNALTNDTGLSAGQLEHNPELVNFLQENGIGAVSGHLTNGGGAKEIIVLHPENVKTKQQLTDLYNQAHAEAKSAPQTIDSPSPTSTVGNDGQSALAEQRTGVAMQHTNGAGEESSVIQSRLQAWETLKQQNPTQAWANNPNFDRQIKNLIHKHEDATSLDTAIRGIKAQFNVEGFPEAVAKKLSKMGYIPIKPVVNEAPFKEGAGVITSKFAQDGDVWTKAVQPLPILGTVGSLITGMGLSPQNATQRVYQMYNQNLAENLAKTSAFSKIAIHGDSAEQTSDMIIKRLSDFAHNPSRGGFGPSHVRPPITDMRQLTTKDIQTALAVSPADAREIAASLMDSMLQVPLQVRGLGDKIADINYKINPTAKAYARIQGASRFSWNPFFQAKLAYKTESLAQLETHGKLPTIAGTNKIMSVIFPEHYSKLNDIRETLRTNGIFDQKATFGEVVGGEGVNDAGAAGANLTHKLLPSQEISISGVVATQADKMGLSVEDYVKNFPTQVRDSVQAIAQYDRNAQFLNSPLARTLNLAFFPFRFETKVAGFMARSLATTSTMTQFAVIKGLYNGSNFLKSPQGQVWYSQNSDVIKLLTYFTPVTTLSYFATALGGKPDSVGAFGELGGLPLGWIPQLLDAEGLTHITQSAYLDPKTGNEIPGYVPATDKGSLLVAVQDLIGQLFTYPGSELGLPSKSSITRNIALGLTGANKKTDLKQAPQLPLSPDQQSFQQAVQAANPQPAPQQSTTKSSQLNKPVPGINVPAGYSPLTTPIPKKVGGSGSGGSKKKKSQFTPQLMPGQTSLGVIPGVQ